VAKHVTQFTGRRLKPVTVRAGAVHHACAVKTSTYISLRRSIGGDLVQGLGGRGRRVSAENFLLPSPLKCEIWGGGRPGTHCIREFQYLTHGFCVIWWLLIFSLTVLG